MTYKQVIIVRNDLKMGKGKIAAQVAHAAVGSMKKSRKRDIGLWEDEGSRKIVLKVDGLRELNEMRKKVEKRDISFYMVRDAGHTQIKRGTITCLGIGPVREEFIDDIIEELKLL